MCEEAEIMGGKQDEEDHPLAVKRLGSSQTTGTTD